MSATTMKHSLILSLVLGAALLSLAYGAGDAAKLSQLRRGRRLGSSSGKGTSKGGSAQGTDLATFQLDKQQHCAIGLKPFDAVTLSAAGGKSGKAGKAGGSVASAAAGGKSGKAGKGGGSSRRRKLSSGSCGKGKGKGGGSGFENCNEEKTVKMNLIASSDCDNYCACMCDDKIIPTTITVNSEVAVKGKAGKAGSKKTASAGIKVNSDGSKGKAGKAGSKTTASAGIKVNSDGSKGKAGKAGSETTASAGINVNSDGSKGKAGKAGSETTASAGIKVNSDGSKGKGGKAGSSSRRLSSSSGKGKGSKSGEGQSDRVAELAIIASRVNESCGPCTCNRNEPAEPVVVEIIEPTKVRMGTHASFPYGL